MTNKKIKNNKTMAKKTPPALKAARLRREAEEQRLAQQKDDEFEEMTTKMKITITMRNMRMRTNQLTNPEVTC